MKALKKLQKQTAEIEAEFYAEVQQLECKYASLYEPIYDKVDSYQINLVIVDW